MKKIVLILGCTFLLFGCNSPQVKLLRENDTPAFDNPVVTNQIQIKNGQFEPKIIQVVPGQKVTFINLDKSTHTVASDPYPKNDALPDLYSPPLYSNDKYEYSFNLYGTWGFHLEDNPSVSGKVLVE